MGWAKYMEDDMDAISERLVEKDVTWHTSPRHTVTEVKRPCVQSLGDSFLKANKRATTIVRRKHFITGVSI